MTAALISEELAGYTMSSNGSHLPLPAFYGEIEDAQLAGMTIAHAIIPGHGQRPIQIRGHAGERVIGALLSPGEARTLAAALVAAADAEEAAPTRSVLN